MREWGSIETGTVATISTAHLPKDALDLLNAVHGEKTQEIDDPNHWVNHLVWASHPYGYMVTGSTLRSLLENKKEDTPEFLLEAAQLATDLNLAWLNYDEDAMETEGLKDYYNE